MHDFSDQIAIVTGGTRGIGAAISRSLLRAGAQVTATYLSNEEAAEEFRGTCRPDDGRLSLHRFDVADPAAVQRFFTGFEGPLHILVNNSAIRRDAVLGLMSQKSWDQVLAVNLSGPFQMCKHAVRLMLSNHYGRIVNISSPAASSARAGQANYAASKAGLVALSRVLALEVAPRGITVNCISPGFILTDLINNLPPEKLASFQKEIPLQRFGTPEEVAMAVLFLASREASYITGATLNVTGGI